MSDPRFAVLSPRFAVAQLDEIPPAPCPAKHAAPSSVTTEGLTTGTIAIEGECRQSESITSL